MKSLFTKLSIFLLSTAACLAAQTAQPAAQKTDAAKPDPHAAMNQTQAPQTEAQKAFQAIKSLAGNWEGPVSNVPGEASVEGKIAKTTLRETSMGNVLMHEMRVGDRPDDPITMVYMEDGRLLLTHYCDAGNRPRMVGKVSADGKKIEFEFLDISGDKRYHMHSALFTIIDENHHTEDWTFMVGDKAARPHFDLFRTKTTVAAK